MVTKEVARSLQRWPDTVQARLIGSMTIYPRAHRWKPGLLLSLAALVQGSLHAQMHKVAKPETVVRAVGVYEWTGDMAKPNASRLIPITLYIDKHLEDAGLYLARPVPFALQSGNVYELDEAGVPKGNLDLAYARHLEATNTAQAYDDGWFGYGKFLALVPPKKLPTRKLPPARTSGIETASTVVVDPDKPHFVNKAGQPVVPGSPDTNQPTTAKADSPAPDADPDRPTMKRRSGNDTADVSATTATPAPDDDADRPTLKRRSPDEAKAQAKAKSQSTVTAVGSLNDDPDRPNLHRGKPTSAMTEADIPKLNGLPVDLRQMVAVSDAANRPVHDFARAWEDDAERAAILGKMQAMAQAQLAAYAVGTPANAKPPAKPTAARPNNKMRALNPVKITTNPLLDEQLKGYLLSYGDVPTFVYQAHTEGTGADLRYVTIVAQRDAQGEPKMVLHAVTDTTHLDRTARLRLVDAVDIDASNRASLLFEMRGQTSRQFGVYRILGLQAEQIFTTGTTQ